MNDLGRRKPQKKSGKQVMSPESKINLIVAILELATAILMLVETLSK